MSLVKVYHEIRCAIMHTDEREMDFFELYG